MISSSGLWLLLGALLCLGTWPAVIEICGRSGRHPCHVYLDYSAAYFVVTCGVAAACDSSFFQRRLPVPLVLTAAGGGTMLMLGNLSFQRSLLLGVPVTVVLPLQASLTVVLGTSLNYWLQPELSS